MDIFLWVRIMWNSLAEIRTHDTLIMSSTLCLLRHQCFVVNCTSLWYIYHVCSWTSGSLYVSKLTTNLPGLPYAYSSWTQDHRASSLLISTSNYASRVSLLTSTWTWLLHVRTNLWRIVGRPRALEALKTLPIPIYTTYVQLSGVGLNMAFLCSRGSFSSFPN
jgi:hypothetical protein